MVVTSHLGALPCLTAACCFVGMPMVTVNSHCRRSSRREVVLCCFALVNMQATQRAGHSTATLQPRRTKPGEIRDVVSRMLGSHEYVHRSSEQFGMEEDSYVTDLSLKDVETITQL